MRYIDFYSIINLVFDELLGVGDTRLIESWRVVKADRWDLRRSKSEKNRDFALRRSMRLTCNYEL